MAREPRGGYTLTELMIACAILVTVVGIGLVKYNASLRQAKDVVATTELQGLQRKLELHKQQYGSYPASLDELGLGLLLDPWGNPYQYLSFATIQGNGLGQKRKDRFVVPINSHYDLYSMGPDGDSQAPLTAKASQDDIIVANDGEYVGPASEY